SQVEHPFEKIELDAELACGRGKAARQGTARRHPQRDVPAVVDPGVEPQGQLADELQQQVEALDRRPVGVIIEVRPAAHGAFRGRVASARISEKRSSGSSQRAVGVQPPARSSVYWLRRSNLWLFSVWMVSPRAIAKRRPATSKATSSRASRCISIRAQVSFQRATWRSLSSGIVPPSSRLMRAARLRLNAAVTPAASS